MATEKFANNAQTTLNGAIDNSTTTVTVTSASAFPTSGNFRILVDAEIMLVTAVAANVFTATRGQESTSAVSHLDNATVTHILTLGSLDQKRTEDIYTAAHASRLTAEKDGRLFLPSDGFLMERDNSSSWTTFGPVFPFTPPSTTGFAWVNQGTATVSSTKSGLYMAGPATGNSNDVHAYVKSVPSIPYTVTAAFLVNPTVWKDQLGWGMCWRQSSDGKLANCQFQADTGNGYQFLSSKFTNPTTFSANYVGYYISQQQPTFIRMEDDNANRNIYFSGDGQNWIQVHTVARTDFLTADQIGFFVNARNTSTPNLAIGVNCIHWVEA